MNATIVGFKRSLSLCDAQVLTDRDSVDESISLGSSDSPRSVDICSDDLSFVTDSDDSGPHSWSDESSVSLEEENVANELDFPLPRTYSWNRYPIRDGSPILSALVSGSPEYTPTFPDRSPGDLIYAPQEPDCDAVLLPCNRCGCLLCDGLCHRPAELVV